jgi:hypothetical protein
VSDFQDEFLHTLEEKHAPLLSSLKAGKYTDEIVAQLSTVAKEIAKRYE